MLVQAKHHMVKTHHLPSEVHAAPRAVILNQIACGSAHSIVVTDNGQVLTFGRGQGGRLGHGDELSRHKPRLVTTFQGSYVTQIAAGSSHSMALTKVGAAFTWGSNEYVTHNTCLQRSTLLIVLLRGRYGQLGVGNALGANENCPTRINKPLIYEIKPDGIPTVGFVLSL